MGPVSVVEHIRQVRVKNESNHTQLRKLSPETTNATVKCRGVDDEGGWAIDGARTRDNQSHNLGLYQLSYDRRELQIYGVIAEPIFA
ncbi:MAG: hypothetical protein RLZZ273_248, partial [Bacteroidota bacterium]